MQCRGPGTSVAIGPYVTIAETERMGCQALQRGWNAPESKSSSEAKLRVALGVTLDPCTPSGDPGEGRGVYARENKRYPQKSQIPGAGKGLTIDSLLYPRARP
mgnify:CR=1 FL=1